VETYNLRFSNYVYKLTYSLKLHQWLPHY